MSWQRVDEGSCILCASSAAPKAAAPLALEAGRLVLCEDCATDLAVALRVGSPVAEALRVEHATELAAYGARLDQVEQALLARDAELESERLQLERVEGERDRALEILAEVRTTLLGNLAPLEESRGG
jgi:hypothetical protein